ncbi:MAG: RtcB family protein [Bacteroidota bacterium]|nr:RtcB family protein [Bacteroidota bacterium]
MINDVEPECIKQIQNMIDHSAFTKDVVIMPDTHAGKGSVIGFTMPLSEKIIPNVIGVDIGCGMISVKFGGNLNFSIPEADKKIKKIIPMGFKIHPKPVLKNLDLSIPNKAVSNFVSQFNKKFNTNYLPTEISNEWLQNKIQEVGIKKETFYNSIGSLGGGNHFIEIGKSNNNYFLTIHSGSRNFGLRIADYWQKVAINNFTKTPSFEYKKEVERIKKTTKDKKKIKQKIKELRIDFPIDFNKELAFLTGNQMMQYLTDMIFAQYYASLNRKTILERIIKVLEIENIIEEIESVHNYVDFNDFIIRKGAISSYSGKKMIIPFNMRDGLLICEGITNESWNFSAPHGAGRIMSRTKAKKTVNLEAFKNSMKNVYSSCISEKTLDESPFVYKDSKLIESLIKPSAKIIERVKPILNIKAM